MGRVGRAVIFEEIIPAAPFGPRASAPLEFLLPPPSEQQAGSSSLHLQARCTVGETTSFVRPLGRSAMEEVEADHPAVIGSRDGPLDVGRSEPARCILFGWSDEAIWVGVYAWTQRLCVCTLDTVRTLPE